MKDTNEDEEEEDNETRYNDSGKAASHVQGDVVPSFVLPFAVDPLAISGREEVPPSRSACNDPVQEIEEIKHH